MCVLSPRRYCAQTLEGTKLGHESTVWGLAFSADGALMASSSDDRSVKIWDCTLREGLPLYRLQATIIDAHERAVYSVHWSQNGVLASGCGAPSICFVRLLEVFGGVCARVWHLRFPLCKQYTGCSVYTSGPCRLGNQTTQTNVSYSGPSRICGQVY